MDIVRSTLHLPAFLRATTASFAAYFPPLLAGSSPGQLKNQFWLKIAERSRPIFPVAGLTTKCHHYFLAAQVMATCWLDSKIASCLSSCQLSVTHLLLTAVWTICINYVATPGPLVHPFLIFQVSGCKQTVQIPVHLSLESIWPLMPFPSRSNGLSEWMNPTTFCRVLRIITKNTYKAYMKVCLKA